MANINWKKKAGFTLLLISLVATVLAGCGDKSKESSSTTASANAPSGDTIKVNIAINGGINPLTVAREKKLYEEAFKKLNAEVVWSKFPSGPPLLEALVAGRVDLSFLGDGAAITGLSNKLPFQVIGLNSLGKSNSTILVPKDSSIQKLADLKGKKVGLAKGTVANVYLIKVLKDIGLKQSDVNLINLQADDAQAAFESGQLDAWIVWDPYVTLNLNKGAARAIPVETEVLSPGSLIAQTDFAKKHPELVVEFLKVYKQASDYELAHKDEAAKIFEEQTKIPAAVIKQILDRSEPILSTYTQAALDAQQATVDILLESKYIKHSFVFKDAVNDSFVTEALK
ncbi:aliphatic sulfonates family ABC transporter, periplasmic ligand-binding protein [Paenibacillus curdlanolyticus YK9]|uniref:Putative aliphatic sulfonates-binding protein n=1 Tax=Paenibacillus curdlanolyticus YK9 TaxID=717606 RepID=E0I7W1_9BACL|nr:aliphatic sulfonate ABC transporter substrate-binding protein [Paenibacillus curdlanolyticus]EFM11266.1 aliphatic sulfonates family ABC transporter, periplasmic ligand-binding protein [Paenibacillus curdlanolyticus YK9]